MNKDLIISSKQSEVDIALLEEKRLVELHKESPDSHFAVGDIYLGRVKKIAGGLNAAFVEVGHEKDAFLHYFDLGPQLLSFNKYTKGVLSGSLPSAWLKDFRLEKDIEKGGKIDQVLQQGQPVLVQIAKEPISTKGPRITSEVTLAGRYLVLVPFSDRISVSQKIKSREERERLKRLLLSIRPENFGVIVRTVAENKKVAEIDTDLKDLLTKWEHCFNVLKTAKPPQKILGELSRTSAILRDLLNESFSNIHIDDAQLYNETREYLRMIAPDKEKIVKHYKNPEPVFEHFGVAKQIKGLFGKHVNMPSGAYLVIEHTEALHVIDVNSGNTAKARNDQETNALNVNLDAAAEVARQLRLRDMGGIIVIDFIDMRSAENRKKLLQKMIEEMKPDRAKHNILPLSRFGLMEITRERVRPAMNINTAELCPTCKGTGEVQPSVLLVDEIENNLRYILSEVKPSSLTLCVHPFVESYLTRGYPSIRTKWLLKFKKRVKIKPVNDYSMLEYRFLNKNNEEIK